MVFKILLLVKWMDKSLLLPELLSWSTYWEMDLLKIHKKTDSPNRLHICSKYKLLIVKVKSFTNYSKWRPMVQQIMVFSLKNIGNNLWCCWRDKFAQTIFHSWQGYMGEKRTDDELLRKSYHIKMVSMTRKQDKQWG